MPRSKHFRFRGWVIGLVLLAGPVAGQSTGGVAVAPPPAAPAAAATPAASANAPSGAETTGQPVQVAASDLSSLNRLLPVGKTAKKVTVPTVDEEGHLTSVVTMGAITRVDEDNFDLVKVVLTSFEKVDEATPNAVPDQTVITLVNARYHAPTRVLVSDRPVTIRKPTLFMTGDSLRYDSAAGRAVIPGKSTTLLTDAPRLDTSVEEAETVNEDEDDDEDDDTTTQPTPEEPLPSSATPTRR